MQELRAAACTIESKHEKEIASLLDSYKSLYPKWVFELRYGPYYRWLEFRNVRVCFSIFISTPDIDHATSDFLGV